MIDEDRFFGDDGFIRWIYCNWDSFIEGQMVEYTIDKDTLDDAIRCNTDEAGSWDEEDIFNFLIGVCPEYLYDSTDGDYTDVKTLYLSTPDRVGTTREIIEWMISYLAR